MCVLPAWPQRVTVTECVPRSFENYPGYVFFTAPPRERTTMSHHSQGTGAAARRDWLSAEAKAKLEAVVEHIGQPGKGISACDESFSTIDPRFRAVGIDPTEEHRRAYRQCLFEAEGAPDYVAAAILDPETVFQKSDQGVPPCNPNPNPSPNPSPNPGQARGTI